MSFKQPAHGTAELVGLDAIKYTPDTGYTGSDSFTYTLFGCLQCFNGWCSEPEFDRGTVYITVTNQASSGSSSAYGPACAGARPLRSG